MESPEGRENDGSMLISGQRNRDIRPHYPREYKIKRDSVLNWNEVKQEEAEWQAPDKWQRISQMVFRNKVLEIHPVGDRAI